jgi:two-component system OmpR family response regulator
LNTIVLVVDDEPVVANLVARQITADGYTVDIATDGVEGVLRMIEKDYALVVLDIAMPRLAGDDALRIMKAVKPQTPVVTVTGHVGRGEMAETVKLGAVACLAKPYTMEQLRQAVAVGLDANQSPINA